MRDIPQQAVDFICKAEGGRLNAYQDATGKWTVGWGSTTNVVPGMVISEMEARQRLKADLATAASRIERVIDGPVLDQLTDTQYAALLSFVFNVGAAPTWTIWRVINARNFAGVPAQLRRFVYAGGKKLPGLVARRNAEAALWASETPAKKPAVVGIGPVAAAAPVAAAVAHSNPALLPWFVAVGAALCVAGLAYVLFTSRKHTMSVSPDIKPIVDALNAEGAAITAAIQAASTAGAATVQAELDAAKAELATEKQNHADDVAALQAALDALRAAVPA